MPIEFTEAEKQAILASVTIPGGLYDEAALLAALGESIDLEALKATLFTGGATPETTAAALANADRQARQIAGNLAKTELQKIAKKVADNIAEGKRFEGLVGKLDEIKGLDSGRAATLEKLKQDLIDRGVTGQELVDRVERARAKLLRDRKKAIAITEQRFATENGANELAKIRGAKFKRWITANDERVSDMDEANQAQGWIAFDETFSSGDDVPPSHPNCRCTVTYRNNPPSELDEARVDARVESTADAKSEGQ